MLFSIVVAPIYISNNSVGGFPFLHTPSSICICRLFNDGHSDWGKEVPHCSFDWRFSNNYGLPGGSDCLSVMLETQVRFLGREDPLEMEMATHSSALA